ncbi:unnamed protein product [Trichogramma brassicae]|uniref:Uncharacterized protein n=1 Tax=Trichogramma brassicae TaxID=86971 RepID=A0A6H5I0B0_9HYME|nr:unnamed protein product [Trichogramma brassicae]
MCVGAGLECACLLFGAPPRKSCTRISRDCFEYTRALSLPLGSNRAPTHKNTSSLSHGSVSLAWIPSHIGIGGNETVDALARAATESPPAASPPVNFTDLAESFRRDCFTTSIAKCEADGLHKGIIYFDLFHRHEKSTPWFTGRNLPRSMIVTINRIRSNHHRLAESLHRKNIIDNPGCACGSEEESLNHVLWNCGRDYRTRRSSITFTSTRAPVKLRRIIIDNSRCSSCRATCQTSMHGWTSSDGDRYLSTACATRGARNVIKYLALCIRLHEPRASKQVRSCRESAAVYRCFALEYQAPAIAPVKCRPILFTATGAAGVAAAVMLCFLYLLIRRASIILLVPIIASAREDNL